MPAGRVKSVKEVYSDPQVEAQKLVIEVDHPILGKLRLPGSPIKMNRGMRREHTAPPILGANSGEIRRWLNPENSDIVKGSQGEYGAVERGI